MLNEEDTDVIFVYVLGAIVGFGIGWAAVKLFGGFAVVFSVLFALILFFKDYD